MYEIEELDDDLHRIELAKPDGLPEPASAPVNVYLVGGEAPALINAGHPTQFTSLCKALRELDRVASDLERVVYTSWNIDILGTAANLPDVDHFVFSPDMVEPHDYESQIEQRRRVFRSLAEQLVEQTGRDSYRSEAVEAFVERYYPRMPADLKLIPIRGGHTVRCGRFELEVLAAPGPTPGHICLFDHGEGLLFTGDFSLSGMPDYLVGVQDYLISLERLMKIEAALALPNHGRPRRRSALALRQAHRFVNNFLSNAPAAMHDSPTVVEFIENDLGYPVDDLPQMVCYLERYKAQMDELVRARMIDSEGEGLGRRYGTDVDDPRDKARPS